MTTPARAPVPWWVLPALVASALGSAVLTRWLAPAPVTAAVDAPSAAASAPAPAGRQPLDVAFQGLFVIDAQPALALVSVNGAAATLVKPGDALGADARVLRIEPRQLVVRDAVGERAVPLGGAVAVLAGPGAITALRPSSPATVQAAVPPPTVGAVPLPPDDGQAGSGNAAFRAAVAAAGTRPR